VGDFDTIVISPGLIPLEPHDEPERSLHSDGVHDHIIAATVRCARLTGKDARLEGLKAQRPHLWDATGTLI
jgi:hypothetical protein